MALCSGASTALSPPVQQDVKLALAAPAVSSGLRRSRVLFDLSPSSVPSREVPERSTAGPCQVSKRSVETRAAPASRKQVYPWPVVAFCSPSADQASAACCPARSVPSDARTSAAFSRLPVDPNGPCAGQTLDLP